MKATTHTNAVGTARALRAPRSSLSSIVDVSASVAQALSDMAMARTVSTIARQLQAELIVSCALLARASLSKDQQCDQLVVRVCDAVAVVEDDGMSNRMCTPSLTNHVALG